MLISPSGLPNPTPAARTKKDKYPSWQTSAAVSECCNPDEQSTVSIASPCAHGVITMHMLMDLEVLELPPP